MVFLLLTVALLAHSTTCRCQLSVFIWINLPAHQRLTCRCRLVCKMPVALMLRPGDGEDVIDYSHFELMR